MPILRDHPSVRTPPVTSARLHPLDEVATLLGAARDPDRPLPRVEGRGPAVVEVAQVWGDTLLDLLHLAPGQALRIGEASELRGGPDLFVPAAHLPLAESTDSFSLLESEADGTVRIRVSDRWTGWQERGGARRPLAEAIEEARERGDALTQGIVALPLDPGDQLLLQLGEQQILARLAAPGARFAGRVSKDVDLPFLGIMSFSAALAAALSVVIATSPPPMENAVVDIPDRFAEVYLSVPPPPPRQVVAERPANPDAGAGKRQAGAEGKTGRKQGKRQAKGGKALSRQVDKQIAEDAGVLGALADAGALGGVFDSNLSGDVTHGIGSLHGAVGVQMGSGYGEVGRGPGGGGDEIGSFTGTGTRGRSDGTSGDFSGGGDMGPKQDGGVRAAAPPIIIGGLDRGLIDRVIKRHMNQFRFCYQRELTKDPSLQGKVSLRFVIARDGSVSKASIKGSSLGSAAVESCLTERFLRLQFPEPAGGGIVLVTYPFMFSPG